MLLLVLLLRLVVVVPLLTTMAFISIVSCYILDTTTPGLTEEDTAAGATPTSQQTGWQRMILLLEEPLAVWRQMSAGATRRQMSSRLQQS